jgi:alkanesulfonate monooxygenase SsuD/methylene tetrahydromethanopterin reductase-like flavin-dependent oxidoreductase (luciferase family)
VGCRAFAYASDARFTHPLGAAALTKGYFDVMDPFVALSAAAAGTKRLKLGTANLPRDPTPHRAVAATEA